MDHLVPSSQGGSDHPDNLVACCKTLNMLFGSMSVKEKLRAVLKQNGKFVCPNQPTQPPEPAQNKADASNQSANQGKPWTATEDKQLAAAFDARKTVAELSKAHKRSIGGIESRLAKLGKITLEQRTTFPSESK